MTDTADELQRLLDAQLAGEPVEVPTSLRESFDNALAAHQALRSLLDETVRHSPESAATRLPPDLAGSYEIERELGHGGMGVVYLARHQALNRRVALKVLRPGEQAFGPLLRRFREEAQHLAKLRHPNIVSIHDVGEASGEPYFTMDYIDGESVAAVLARGPLPPTQAVSILKQVAAAVQHAHRQGIIHRDLKPGNVLLDRIGHVFVTDFGLARDVTGSSELTRSGELLGTPQYMAPEQARGQTGLIGEATDIHALGLLLFEMLAGAPPYGAGSPADSLVKLLNEEPPSLRAIDRRIPRDLETICLKSLQKAPAARYANVSALLEDVRRLEAGEPLVARRSGWVVKASRWCSRRWKPATAVLATAVVVAILSPILFDRSFDELLLWADEEFRSGRPVVAAQVYERAFHKADAQHRDEVSAKLAEAIRAIDDPTQAVPLALTVAERLPQASFGRHDFLVAQALVMSARAETPSGVFEPDAHRASATSPSPTMEFAARRLTLFLEGPGGTETERGEAEGWLAAIRRSLQSARPIERWTSDELVQLPEGNLEELTARRANSQASAWDRGKAAMAAGRLQEAKGETDRAFEAYRQALDLLRPIYPFLSGVATDSQASGPPSPSKLAPECRLMRELVTAIERLGGPDDKVATGNLVLVAEPSEELGELNLAVRVEVWGPESSDPNQGLSRNLASYFVIDQGRSAPAKLIAGTYRIRFGGTLTSFPSTSNRSILRTTLIDIAPDNWPTEITIADGQVELPLRVRELTEILVDSPREQAPLDLQRDQIRWTPVAGAATYQLQFGQFRDHPTPSATWFVTVSTDRPSWNSAELTSRDRELIRKHWPTGQVAGVRVVASDADGQRIGVTVEERGFLIATGLTPEN
ncbi:MAG: serine/threonine protein kinase [Planctomycetaceae bacterium]|nr:MAG: serine/threonine protein kinase [Planctomycetaceae bacterium]